MTTNFNERLHNTRQDFANQALAELAKPLLNRTIKAIRFLTKTELITYGWRNESGIVIVLDNGITIIPTSDPEGNGPGHIIEDYISQ